jgi:DNA-3-methyladenine glycosylase II
MTVIAKAKVARLDQAGLASGLGALASADPVFAAALRTAGEPALRKRPQGFATLLDIIVGQQVSVASAAAIKARFKSIFGTVTADAVLAASDETLRACGLSRQKLAYVRDLAAHVASGRLDLKALARMEEEDAVAALCDVKGIGRWTAEIYLLFALGRPDIFPADDLGLAIGAQRLLGLEPRPDARALRAMAEIWQPHRGAAAHFLWHYYHFTVRT